MRCAVYRLKLGTLLGVYLHSLSRAHWLAAARHTGQNVIWPMNDASSVTTFQAPRTPGVHFAPDISLIRTYEPLGLSAGTTSYNDNTRFGPGQIRSTTAPRAQPPPITYRNGRPNTRAPCVARTRTVNVRRSAVPGGSGLSTPLHAYHRQHRSQLARRRD